MPLSIILLPQQTIIPSDQHDDPEQPRAHTDTMVPYDAGPMHMRTPVNSCRAQVVPNASFLAMPVDTCSSS